jgi:hypothetical protein
MIFSLPPRLTILVVIALIALVLQPSCWRLDPFTAIGDTSPPLQQTLFISIASYRDSECSETIRDIYTKAKYPERIFCGICEQNSGDVEEACVRDAKGVVPRKNLRVVRLSHTQAKGPTYARYICSRLWRGEAYFLQIDSHSTFVPHFDEILIQELHKTGDPENSVLTSYPHDKGQYSVKETSAPVICNGKWNEDGLPVFEAVVKPKSFFNDKPVPTGFASAGLLFGPGDMLRRVPYDPNLPHLFQGEEFLYTVRLWTSGFNLYCPSKNVVLHHYLRSEKPKYWTDMPKAYNKGKEESIRRVKRLTGIEQPVIPQGSDPFGLGTTRTMTQYWNFVGLDPTNKQRGDPSKFCG